MYRLKEPNTIGAIELLTKETSCQLQGTLIKTPLGYRFKTDCNECSCEKCAVDLPDIVSTTFFTENNGKIYEYNASLEYKDRYNIYISKLTHKPTFDYFSLLWDLDGILLRKGTVMSEASIYRIGGNSVSFYINENPAQDQSILKKINNVIIIFEDGSTIKVSGKITKMMKVNCKLYCDFKYLNILERDRDNIFKQIFEKQASLRNRLLYPKRPQTLPLPPKIYS